MVVVALLSVILVGFVILVSVILVVDCIAFSNYLVAIPREIPLNIDDHHWI